MELWDIEVAIGGGRKDANVRKGGGATLPRCVRPLIALGRLVKLGDTEYEMRGGRMGANVRKGGRTALHPLHSAAIVCSKGGWNYGTLKLK